MQKLVWVAIVAGVIFSCNNGTKGSPKESLEKFLSAMEKSNFTEAKKYATDDSQDFLTQLQNHSTGSENIYSNKTFNITGVEVNGDEAKAEVQAGTGATLTFNLKYQHGDWKVSFNMSAIMQMVTDVIKKEGVDINKDINKALDSIKINLDSLP
ncbi:MAG TPA: hypothetical protein VG738_24020 [Chitinophagaceae bacterium]|nr:hypothetical protein [Chitinophagaceae bacterium]